MVNLRPKNCDMYPQIAPPVIAPTFAIIVRIETWVGSNPSCIFRKVGYKSCEPKKKIDYLNAKYISKYQLPKILAMTHKTKTSH